MPRYRKLHTKILESLDVNDMPDDFCRLLWTLLPLIVCRDGKGIDNPAWVKSKVFPLRLDIPPERVGAAMDWFGDRGMIERYEVEGRSYFRLVRWTTYQGDTSRETASDYPDPPDLVKSNSGVSQELVKTNSCSDANADAAANANADAAAAVQDSAAACIQAAEEYGLDPEKAPGLVAQYGPETVLWNIEEVRRQEEAGRTKIDNPPGLVVDRLKAGRKPPARASPKTQREALAGGQYEGIIET